MDCGAALVALVAAFVTVWAGYQFEVGRPAEAHPVGLIVFRDAAPQALRPFAEWVAKKVPLPAPMFPIGIAFVRLHDQSGHLAYLLGKHSYTGWWYYFPVVFFFKTPIPFLILALWGIVLLLRARTRLEHVVLSLVMFAVVMPASLNIGLRYVLGVYVSLSMVAAYAAVEIWRRASDAFSRAALAGLVVWMFAGVAASHPDYLAWFNELAQPVPSRITVDSNLDWGQDGLRLAREVRERHIDKLWTLMATNVLMERHGIHAIPLGPGRPVHGWVAVGETPLRLYEMWGGFEWLSPYRPVAKVGESIRLYYIP